MELLKYHSVVIFYNPQTKQVLLHKRDAQAPVYPNTWALFGGGSESQDEGNPVKTLIREMKEELGIDLVEPDVKLLREYVHPEHQTQRYVFMVKTDLSGKEIRLTEGDGYTWMSLQQAVNKSDVIPQTKQDLEYFINNKSRKTKLLIELFGWYGALALVIAYGLVSFSVIAPIDLTYQVLNGTGALGIVLVSLYKKAYQPGVLNIIWASIALMAILGIIF